jgi:hypothetical protein
LEGNHLFFGESQSTLDSEIRHLVCLPETLLEEKRHLLTEETKSLDHGGVVPCLNRHTLCKRMSSRIPMYLNFALAERSREIR